MKALVNSFRYAAQGIWYCLRHERNMRIHVVCMAYMYGFLGLYDFFVLTRTEWALLFVANALVVMGELINTAIESTINLVESRYHKLAKVAKDTAAGAVLVGAIFAVATGIALLWQPDAFRQLYAYYQQQPYMFAAFVISLGISLLFIFGPKGKHKNSA